MAQAAPLTLFEDTVPPEWIDYNGHMNVAYYVLAFDRGTDALLDYIGMDEHYRRTQNCSVFTLEIHVNYLQELAQGNPIRCSTQLLDYDAKRIHYFEYLHHAEQGYLAATSELILLHMDMGQRRNAAMPQTIQDRLQALLDEHQSLTRPEQVGSTIGIRRRS